MFISFFFVVFVILPSSSSTTIDRRKNENVVSFSSAADDSESTRDDEELCSHNYAQTISLLPKNDDVEGSEFNCSQALSCDQQKCKLPCCFCSGFHIPGGLLVHEVPQMVSLTFQAAVQQTNVNQYAEIFRGRLNPNDCPATGTFFVLHEYTDYVLVHSLYAARHEIGVNGITSKSTPFDWKNASLEDWIDEVKGEIQIIGKFANVSKDSIRGVRVPYLQMGGNNQMAAISLSGLTYDSTRSSVHFAEPPSLLWPYTYDYATIQDCPSTDCPNCSFPDIWEVPLLAFTCPDGKSSATADGCHINNQAEAYKLLLDKFHKHYNSSNRAPMVVSLGGQWVTTDYKLKATEQFVNYLSTLKDVYVVSSGQVIDWIKHPTPIKSLSNFKPWMCNSTLSTCNGQSNCFYDKDRKRIAPGQPSTYRLVSCMTECPPCYPWIKDPSGTSCISGSTSLEASRVISVLVSVVFLIGFAN